MSPGRSPVAAQMGLIPQFSTNLPQIWAMTSSTAIESWPRIRQRAVEAAQSRRAGTVRLADPDRTGMGVERMARPRHRGAVMGDAGHHAPVPEGGGEPFDIADPVLERQRVARRPQHPRQQVRDAGGLVGADEDQRHVRRLDLGRIAGGARPRHEVAGDAREAQPLRGHRVDVVAPAVEQRDVVIPPGEERAERRAHRAGTHHADVHRPSPPLANRLAPSTRPAPIVSRWATKKPRVASTARRMSSSVWAALR